MQKNKINNIDSNIWNVNLQQTIETKRIKLFKYYNRTKQFFEKYLNFAIILNLDTKLKLYRINNQILFYHKNLSHWKLLFQWLQIWKNEKNYFIFYRVDFF